ncbi:RHS repeat-associated core domain-containing protein [Pseudomonas mosselii]|uniref:RHS repeat-associated core domain-containing protein n=1 Tax=Pseudomonas mosselii TaxID=78327 RepID=UPI002162C559|nr:RHS repeat-associated core domain-containing protein [Pseudomonas mosselii]UVN47079.1 RHS repeat-associated core domain-containing protein [Pseudomonas mosselii]
MRAATYTPYGLETALQSCLGFTGQLRATGLQGYLLGNGYRLYSTIFMRFHSPDSLSPFLEGGINCYVYCNGDPVNFSDPTGHMLRSSSPGRHSRAGNINRRTSESEMSPSQTLEAMMAQFDRLPPPDTNAVPPPRNAVHGASSPITVTGPNSSAALPNRESIKASMKAAVDQRRATATPTPTVVSPDRAQAVMVQLRRTSEALGGVTGSFADPAQGLTFNNYLDALVALSRATDN